MVWDDIRADFESHECKLPNAELAEKWGVSKGELIKRSKNWRRGVSTNELVGRKKRGESGEIFTRPVAVPDEGVPSIGLSLDINWYRALKGLAKPDINCPGKWEEPSDEESQVVMALVITGVPQEKIRQIVGPQIPIMEFKERHREILDTGIHIANTKIASVLFTAAAAGDLKAMMFWLSRRSDAFREKVDTNLNAKVAVIDFRRDLPSIGGS